MKTQLEPVCEHFPLPKENKVTDSGLNVVFLETSVAFMASPPCTQNVTKRTDLTVSLYRVKGLKRVERGLSVALSHRKVMVDFHCDREVNTHEIYLHDGSG